MRLGARARGAGGQDLRDHELPGRCPGLSAGGPDASATATYHDSCAGLRELGILAQPRKLLAAVDGLEMRKLEGNDVCCGFGGTFCVKYPAISNAIVEEKAQAIEHTGADLLLAGDLGCLMNMAGKLNRRGRPCAASTPSRCWPAWPTARRSARRADQMNMLPPSSSRPTPTRRLPTAR